MDSFELNKIIGAILGTLLFVMGVGFLAEAIYEPAHGSGPGYNLPAAPEDNGNTTTTAPATADIGTLLHPAGGPGGQRHPPAPGAAQGEYRPLARLGRPEGGPRRRQEVGRLPR